MVDFNPYGSVDDGPMYKVFVGSRAWPCLAFAPRADSSWPLGREERKSASSPTQPWVVGYRNSPSSPIVSPMGKVCRRSHLAAAPFCTCGACLTVVRVAGVAELASVAGKAVRHRAVARSVTHHDATPA